MVPLSVLDLVSVAEGKTPVDALRDSLTLARHVERLGYKRFWVAEHHNMVGIASAATAVVIGHLAAGTSTIRVGAGGIMLPNHSPLIIAEQFGTLESLHPGRIDLGVGRAPGADMRTFGAMRRDPRASDDFPQDVQELQALLAPVRPGQVLQAVPGAGTEVPIWILGSSLYGAQLAALLGLPYAFASHFAPDALMQALEVYRSRFQPSEKLAAPHAMVAVNVIAADTDAAAERLFTTLQQAFTNLRRGRPAKFQPPIDDIDQFWTPAERAQAEQMLSFSVVGSSATVGAGLRQILRDTRADELLIVSSVHDQAARARSYELVADIAADIAADRPSVSTIAGG